MNLSQFLDEVTFPNIKKTPGHSTTKTTVPAYSQDYLANLTSWVDIDDEIERFFGPHLSVKAQRFNFLLDVIQTTGDRNSLCSNEADVVTLGTFTYEAATLRILDEILSTKCNFGGHQSTVNIGDPDRVLCEFIDNGAARSNAKFIMEWKTPWALTVPPDMVEHFNRNRGNPGDKVVKAVSQLYGYMTFNNLLNGGLCNYEVLYLLQRTGDIGLKISRPFRYNDRGIGSPIAALTYICHYAITKEFCHYSSVGRGSPRAHMFRLEDLDVEGTWDENLKVPWADMRLRLTSAVSKNIASPMSGEVFARPGTRFKYKTAAFFKVYDITKGNNLELANAEIKAYINLKALQGKYIPRLYAAGTTWGSLKFLVLEDCGQTLSEENIDQSVWAQARKIIQALHKRGYIHGDPKLDNFAISRGVVRVIDLGACRRGSLTDQSEERSQLDQLKREWEEEQEDNSD
ncbi:hypothetical protein TWF730_011138 [Orbilia blumenaviensis]|uniref:Protein kinase domain-containing protein n=1 Tax=Orbilia blumenaviensis TaxID=1796055 RepID=A0AAV9UP00_9PEZI